MGRNLEVERTLELTVKSNDSQIEKIKTDQIISAAGQSAYFQAISSNAYDITFSLPAFTFQREIVTVDFNSQNYPLATLGVKAWMDGLTDADLIFPGTRNFYVIDLAVDTIRQKKWQVTIRNPSGEPTHTYYLKFWVKATDIPDL